MFALPGKEREAFFDLLDEYFSQRPHLLQNYQRPSEEPVSSAPVGLKKPAPPPPPRQHQRQVNSSLGSTHTTNTNGIESDLQEMHVSPMHKDIRKPEGLTTTKQPPASVTASAAQTTSTLGEAVALYTFQGGQPGDLSFVQGERISLLEKVSDDWFRARNAEGHIGIVPTNYIERNYNT
ncbi:hypothetical protein MGL_2290 [Malassezia globosa CBS 7966]|uniref:SH3 domain-containing protein n=1 Tax=Malassezia globosa (strain ATCC MYA-4612 / CBS 7966) TaxID=425265 RepID=A8Q316_MALGO|nr:uncharacterized protein MGL_2290 [Malassezia globosa CBS 7966]EDP43280.1 hypothetical protein MGL_2290 [Malassezia globosa CBS 7966]